MKTKIFTIIFFGILLISTAILPISGTFEESTFKTQSNGVEWAKTYGGDEFDMFHCVHQTHDKGFIASGVSEISDNYYPILMKLDSDGDEEWTWTIQQIAYEKVSYDILDTYPIFSNQVNDRGYLFCLWFDVNYEDIVVTIAGLFKINEIGDLEWAKFYSEGFEWGFRPISFIEIDDSFVVAGTSGPPSSYMGDEAALLKIDKMGNEQWYREYDFGDADNFDNRMEAVCRTSDGGYVITGWGSDTSCDYWMIKTDEYGIVLWDKTFGGSGDDYCHTKECYQTSDGGYVMGGFGSSFGAGRFDLWIIKTDSEGNMVWNTTFGGTKNDVCWDMESTDDEGYVMVATMNYNGFSGDKDDINLVKIDGDGKIVWVQEYGGSGIQLGTSIDETIEDGFIVSGCTGAFHSSTSDGLLVKFASFENQRPNKPTTPSGPSRGKPGQEYTFTTSAADPDGDQLMYKWDWGDGNYSEWLDTTEASYNWTGKNNYNIRTMAKDEHGGESDWSDALPFSTPKNRIINPLFLQFLEDHSHLFPILRQILLYLK